MTRITSDHVARLAEADCLSIREVREAPRDPFIDPRDFKNNTWQEKTHTRVEAELCGTPIEASFDPNRIGSAPQMLEKIVAAQNDAPEPEPRPTENEVINEALAEAITSRWPHLSNHTRLRILQVLEIEEDAT